MLLVCESFKVINVKNGESLVFIHGLGASSSMYKAQVDYYVVMLIDNNRTKPSIKTFVIGRKLNFLEYTTSAQASAIVYSVVETAKENGLNPFDYLTYLFEMLLNIDTEDTDILDQLLSWSSPLPETCHVIKNT